MRILQQSTILFVLMNAVLIIDAETNVSLFRLLDSDKDGFVNVLDVDRVNNLVSLGTKENVKKLKRAIYQYDVRRVTLEQFRDLLTSYQINESIDLEKFLKGGKNYFSLKELEALLNLGETVIISRKGIGKAYAYPGELATFVEKTVDEYNG